MAWAPNYCSTAQLRQFARIDDLEDDAELDFAIATSSRAVDKHCGPRWPRQFGKTDAPEQRRYKARWNRRRCRWIVEIDDLMDDTGDDPTVDAGTVDLYTLEPINAAQLGKPWTHLVIDPDAAAKPASTTEFEFVMTRTWGWTTFPDAVVNATLLQANRVHSRRFSPYGIAGSPDTGSELRLLARVDPDVAVALKDFVRRKVGVG